MAKFKIDENLPVELAQLLAAAGHDAATVPDQNMGGAADPQLAIACQQECRAILTLDLDFADIRAYPPSDYAGIIVLRLARLDKLRLLAAIQRLIPSLDQEPLIGNLWIVEESRIRIRS
jgi:predicted nuclease of predicted toxin-antitoxin system